MSEDPFAVNSLTALEALYGTPGEASLIKESAVLTPEYRAMVEAAPFAVLASIGADGLDASPRGDAYGLVGILDDRTLALPDRRGNNRMDTLRNIVQDPRVALLFLVPGCNETLRINGRAEITTDPMLRERFTVQNRVPATVLRISIDVIYFQCGRAVVRSGLWNPDAVAARASLPSPGDMLRGAASDFDGAAYDAALPERQKKTLY